MEARIAGLAPTKTLRSLRDLKALAIDPATSGGYTVADQLHNDLLQAESQLNVLRQIGRVLPSIPPGASLLVPSVASLMADAEWTTELDWGGEDSSLSFGQRRLTPKPIAKAVRATKNLARSPGLDVQEIIRDQLANAVARPQERSFINGDGVGECLGVLHTPGLPVYETAAARTVTADDIIGWTYSLPARYLRQPSCRILCNAQFVKKARQLKDGSGQLIYPDGNIGFPYAWSDELDDGLDANNAWEEGATIAVIGDWRYFWIVDALGIEIQRYVELFSETNQDAWSIRQETDAMLVLPEAFCALKVKAS